MKVVITIQDVEGEEDCARVRVETDPPATYDTKMTTAGTILVDFLKMMNDTTSTVEDHLKPTASRGDN